MKPFIKNILGITVLLIFMGLSTASVSAAEYEFGNNYQTELPSGQAFDDGIFSSHSNDMYAPQMKIWGDGDDDDFPDDGGDECLECYNDVPVGNGIYVLMLMVIVYGGMLYYRRRRETVS